MSKYDDLLALARELPRIAEREILPRFQSVTVEHKADGTEITEADRAAEVAMRAAIRKQYPSHGIQGEEGKDINPGSDRQWILDPIDGTTWFALGLPRFGTLVALLEEGEPVLGVIHLPITHETMYASSGKGCWYQRGGEVPTRVRVDDSVSQLPEAFISSAGVHNSEIEPVEGHVPIQLGPVIRRARKFRFIGDCIQHMMVARGQIHAAVDTIMEPWDTAALVPCIQEAGGVASTMGGDRTNVVFGGSLVTASHPRLHEKILDILSYERASSEDS